MRLHIKHVALFFIVLAICALAQGQVAYQLSPVPHQQFLDSNGKPLAGGLVYTYSSGSTTPLATYKDNAGTANTNPIVLDAGGFATIYLGQNSYKFVVQNSSAVQQWSQDNVQNISQVLLTTANVWTAAQTFNGLINFLGGTSDTIAADGNFFYRTDLHRGRWYDSGAAAWHSIVGADSTDTLTNKTLTAPTLTSPVISGTGIVVEGSCGSGSGGNDTFCGETADHLLHYNPNNSGLQQVPFVLMTTSTYTNATTTFSNVFSSNPVIAASRNYTMRCELAFQSSAGTAGPKFQVTGPAGVSGMLLNVDGATNATAYASALVMGFSTPDTALGTVGATATDLIAHVVIGIRNGINSGAIQLQAAANGAGTLTIEASSFCVLQ